MSSLAQRVATKRITLTSKQANIYTWGWQSEARFRYAVCGRRFGKTYLLMDELRRAVRLAVERNIDTDNEIWYGGTTGVAAEKNFWKRALRACPEEWIAHVNNSKHTITYHSGHVFRMVGLEDHDALRGSGLFFFMGDEWADTKPLAWTETIRPMLATTSGHALFIGTPKGFNFFYDGYAKGQPGDGKDPEIMSWKYSTIEGGNVPQSEIDAARASTDARTFRQEWEASFEQYAGMIYYAFNRTHNIKPPPWFASTGSMVNDNLPLHVGLDFNINPMTAHVYQELVEKHPVTGAPMIVSYQIAEIHMTTSNTNEMANELSNRYKRLGNTEPLKHITIYPDPAGASGSTKAMGETDISILRRAGFSVYAMSTHPAVRDRINIVNAKYCAADGSRSLFIGPNCLKSIASAEKQSYKAGSSEPDKSSGHDHDNDAAGYYVYTRFAHQKPRMDTIAHIGR